MFPWYINLLVPNKNSASEYYYVVVYNIQSPRRCPVLLYVYTYYTVVVSGQKYNNIRIVDNIHTYSTTFMRVHIRMIYIGVLLKQKYAEMSRPRIIVMVTNEINGFDGKRFRLRNWLTSARKSTKSVLSASFTPRRVLIIIIIFQTFVPNPRGSLASPPS